MQSRKGRSAADRQRYRDPITKLSVDNCSEIELAGEYGYIQNGTFYDICCNLEGGHCFCGGGEECTGDWAVALMFVGFFVGGICLRLLICLGLLRCSCTCCEPQPIVENDNNATTNGTERSNISTISDNLRQPSRRVATPNAQPTSVLQERLE